MSDIFISYSRDDLTIVQSLVKLFAQRRWSVWWDFKIPPGKIFDEHIKKELNEARCVVVVWSKNSVKSRWVKSEASAGAEREILVPILIDDVDIPLGLDQIHAVTLTGWDGKSTHVELGKLLDAIESALNNNPWVPEVDLKKLVNGNYIVIIELPGVEPDDIEIMIETSFLTVHGFRRIRDILIDGKDLITERRDVRFFRRIPFPEDIEGWFLMRSYRDGILILHLSSESEHE